MITNKGGRWVFPAMVKPACYSKLEYRYKGASFRHPLYVFDDRTCGCAAVCSPDGSNDNSKSKAGTFGD